MIILNWDVLPVSETVVQEMVYTVSSVVFDFKPIEWLSIALYQRLVVPIPKAQNVFIRLSPLHTSMFMVSKY